MSSGGKGGGSPTYAHYSMSIFMGICAGPVQTIREILIGDKVAWSGALTSSSSLNISRPNLFGGKANEGGVEGRVRVYFGDEDQEITIFDAEKMGFDFFDCPGYRGVTTLFFSGNSNEGFLWGTNNPYLKPVAVKVTSIYAPMLPEKAAIITDAAAPDANPAHIILECYLNAVWSSAADVSALDLSTFEAVANTLYDEGLGLSIKWSQQDTVDAFIDVILEHIQGVRYTDPETGLLCLGLIRDDYDPDTLPVLDETNCQIVSFSRKTWGETINEIVVTWTNPETEQPETINIQDLANIAIQGGAIVSQARDYSGVRNSALATRLGNRDLEAAAAPLAIAEVVADRTFPKQRPGSVVKLNHALLGITGLVMRVGDVSSGAPGNLGERLQLAEDVFNGGRATYDAAPVTEWNGRSEAPRAADFVQAFTAPYFFVRRILAAQPQFPEVYATLLVGQTGRDTQGFELWGPFVDPAGNARQTSLGSYEICARGTLGVTLHAEATTAAFQPGAVTQGVAPSVGGMLVIGTGGEAQQELALVSAATEDGLTLLRGVLDTVPRLWPAGTPYFFVRDGARVVDPTARGAGETVAYKVSPQTSIGVLDPALAPDTRPVMTQRSYAPLRPANVLVQGVGFGEVNATGLESLTVSWATRNRLMEDARILAWTDAAVAPEANQRTVVQLFVGGTLRRTYFSTGTTLNVPRADWGVASTGVIRVRSELLGTDSLQHHDIGVIGL